MSKDGSYAKKGIPPSILLQDHICSVYELAGLELKGYINSLDYASWLCASESESTRQLDFLRERGLVLSVTDAPQRSGVGAGVWH